MSNREGVWLDVERCTGCGACIEVCPVEAIALVEGKALLDEKMYTGCQACVDACPESAVQPLVQGEIVTVQHRAVPAVQRPRPLAETAGVAVAAASVGVLAEVAGRLARAVGRWLAQGLTDGGQARLTTASPQQEEPLRLPAESVRNGAAARPASPPGRRRRTRSGRQARRRGR
jgi:dissimilatory sulfite reductase (desulfoviridin) alpha/beta subunit